MQGLDAYYDGLTAQHQRTLDRQAYEDEQRDKLRDRIADLLQEYHFAELSRLTGEDDTLCRKIVHELYSKDPNDWHAEYVGDDYWGIYGKNFSGEWIDEHGDCLCFDTEEEANEYIKEEIK